MDSITDPKKEESSEKPDNMIGASGGLAASMDADLSQKEKDSEQRARERSQNSDKKGDADNSDQEGPYKDIKKAGKKVQGDSSARQASNKNNKGGLQGQSSRLSISDYGSEEEKKELVNSKGNDATDLNQNVSSAGSESYDDESEESESEMSESSSSSEELETSILDLNNESTDYFFSMDTQHKDFVRSMV